MPKEYIEREAAIDAIMSDPPDAHYPSWYIDRIKTLSAADVVEVVRCRECKYSFYDEIFGNLWCNSHSGCRKVKDEGFCDLGERKEGVDNG